MARTIRLWVYKGSLASDKSIVRQDVVARTNCKGRLVSLSDTVIDEAAVALDEEPEDFVPAVLRYMEGSRRKSSRGAPSGIAEFNELLCWVLYTYDGIEIHRVFSSTQPGVRKGNKYPKPDFLVREAGVSGAVECKATDGASYQKHAKLTVWGRIDLCDAVTGAKQEALPQLGLNQDLTRIPMKHELGLKDQLVPFPVAFGRAFAAAYVDGRFRSEPVTAALYSPPSCREADAHCLSCGGDDIDALVFIANNSPGLIHTVPDQWPEFHDLYGQWWRALWAREPEGFRAACEGLLRGLSEVEFEPDLQAQLYEFFEEYFTDAAREKGIPIGESWRQRAEMPAALTIPGMPRPIRRAWATDSGGTFAVIVGERWSAFQIRYSPPEAAALNQRTAKALAEQFMEEFQREAALDVDTPIGVGETELLGADVDGGRLRLGWTFDVTFWTKSTDLPAVVHHPDGFGLFRLSPMRLTVWRDGRCWLR